MRVKRKAAEGSIISRRAAQRLKADQRERDLEAAVQYCRDNDVKGWAACNREEFGHLDARAINKLLEAGSIHQRRGSIHQRRGSIHQWP
eukprot:2441452-Pyramimonas_sp.AAC.1